MASAIGRPSKYREEYAEQVYKLCLLGATDEETADFFGVAVSTLYLWVQEHTAFSESRKRGKEEADGNVADRLYQRAMGYTHPEEKIFQYEGEPVRVDTLKHYPPDTTAAIFWLKNRQPQHWRDRKEHEHNHSGSPQELDRARIVEVMAHIETVRSVKKIEKLLVAAASENGNDAS